MQQSNPTSFRVPDPGIAALFEQDARWQAWLDVEAALAKAEAELGMIPEAAAEEIVKKCDLSLFDRNRLTEGFTR
ncbi:MAG: adenylosuccinate lyase family protein, partial [Pseudomonadota bacterium]|nr:adenylosuccinate lyase family protein [Pseudomonadota bacterium]